MDNIVDIKIIIGLIALVLLIILYMLYRDCTEGMEDKINENVDILSDMDISKISYEEFKNKYPTGDAIIYSDLTNLNLKQSYTKDNIKKIYKAWI